MYSTFIYYILTQKQCKCIYVNYIILFFKNVELLIKFKVEPNLKSSNSSLLVNFTGNGC
ncbi:hypothetical protein Sjap_025744 [Stephania japonica]|uniref:Uncharacterized protein n=1 Tax=Stephania japonica TaxID=461633 RepID=A0AAP0HEG3_9MAGN